MNQIADLKVAIAGRLKGIRTTIDAKLKALAVIVDAVNDKTRRTALSFDFTAAGGTQTQTATWSTPFPDAVYGVVLQPSASTAPAQVHAVPNLGTKTAAGINITVVAGTAVGIVIVEVQALRSV